MHERLTKVFQSLGVDYEIIFVNDGSPDNAREVLDELAARDPNVVVINHTRNFGSQSAFTSGMRIATGDAVVLLDGDLQDPPELIAEFSPGGGRATTSSTASACGARRPWLMRSAYKALLPSSSARLAYVTIPLDAGDFSPDRPPRGRRAQRAAREATGSSAACARGSASARPASRTCARSACSAARRTRSCKNLGWARRAIVSFSYAPLDLIVWLGAFTVGLSSLAMIVQVVLRFVDPQSGAREAFATLFVVILFVGGIQLLCLRSSARTSRTCTRR